MAEAYGLKLPGDGNTGSSGGTVYGGNDKQKALVEQMKSVEGKLAYSQTQRDPEYGSGDCSSTVQWAYQKVLGVDPGNWTGAQEEDSDTYVVANDVNDPSKLQPGDLILYRSGGQSSHVEMYAGNNQMIGHGGGADGTTPGPTMKNLAQDFGGQQVAMVKRWVGFQNGSGSGILKGKNGRGTVVPKKFAYDKALSHVNNSGFKSLLPVGYDQNYVEEKKISSMQYNKDKLSDNTVRDSKGKPVIAAGRGTIESESEPININQISVSKAKEKPTETTNKVLLLLLKSILLELKNISNNTVYVNNIFTLFKEYIDVLTNEKPEKKVDKNSQNSTLLARQNLINAIQSDKNSTSSQNTELLALIELTERIAKQ